MRFFEAQRAARSNSFYLVVLFILSVLLLSWVNSLALGWILRDPAGPFSFYPTDLEKKIFLGSVITFVLFTWYFVATTPSGPALAEAMGGQSLVDPQTEDEKKLRNIVEEMAIASGVPIPAIYVLGNDSGINAFSAGTDPRRMVVAVTRGAMEILSRDELQAVVGHEFSHILNEDMALNMHLAGVVKSFLVFEKLGEEGLSSKSRSLRRSKRGAQTVLFFSVLMVFGALGYFLGRLIQGFISREREYLADASSAQFTRHPEALARALGKILLGAGSEITGTNRWEFAHIFFAEGIAGKMGSWFSTHPPLRDRIAKLLPRQSFEDFLTQVSTSMVRNENAKAYVDAQVEEILSEPAFPGSVLSSIGAPSMGHVAVAERHLDQLSTVRNLLHNQALARATLALLTFRAQTHYALALEHLKPEFVTEGIFHKIQEAVEHADESQRVTMFHLVLNTLRGNSILEKSQLIRQMTSVFESDQKITLLEGLLLINAELLLLPGQKISRSPRGRKEELLRAVCQMPHQADPISLPVLRAFVANFGESSLVEKKKVVEELLRHFRPQELSCKEEFRLLCLAIKVPVPPF